MSGLVIEGVSKSFGAMTAVDRVDLHVPNGTFVCILGPSGCGKTTLLRMIAGLEEPSEGRILVDGRDLTDLPAHKRDFGMVFQSLALFPHLTVGQNIAYPLRIRSVSREEQRRRVAELLTLVQLPGLEDRPVAKLSGGQRQRIAIARALALSPKLFLLDEPLSALDAKLREAMQVELRQLQQKLGITTLVVTHDQREAMTLADLVLVMNAGRIRQAAHPSVIYRQPADEFVADFIGSTNLLEAVRDGEGARVAGAAIEGLRLPGGRDRAMISVRPEEVHLVLPGAGGIPGRVTFVRDLGASIETFVRVGEVDIIALATPRECLPVEAGAEVGVVIPAASAVVLGA
jgi:putative spermidine/putrescine transport system ATP-binding protein